MSRIDSRLNALHQQQRKALIPYITAGDPTAALTVPLMHALAAAGADILEIGVPFSDPMAEGPVIQRAMERALANKVSLRDVLAMVAEFRQRDVDTPVVLMGYANPVEAMGYEMFAQQAAAAGVDGLLTVDFPPEEASGLVEILDRHGIAPIFLLAPTTPESRIEVVGKMARGYVYYVSLRGVTGAGNLDMSEVAARLPLLRKHIKLPIGVGFGIRDGKTARAVAEVADAVVIGSRLVQEIESAGERDAVESIGKLVKDIREAIDHA
ncbi:tryptophan synthase subunit alpha [Chitinivorax sp. B]|uniref:tryptophan synthase subunit alpha n=1 Tax=Chitinivorax sp. B TaxID=2502235 RepID=UPI0010F94638|nr:tryptophan synthase subunit alpha [Chitinivorax sp. B]